MPIYIVEVWDATGKASKKRIEAVSPQQARRLLQNRYSAIGKVKKPGFQIDFSQEINIPQLGLDLSRVTVKDKAVFSRQFAAMVNAGVAIVRCLSILSDECPNSKLKKALLAVSAEVQEGKKLSDAMRKHPECFDELYVSMVAAGEEGGVLDEVLNRLAKLLEDVARLQNQIKSAMTYPIAVGVIAVLVFFAMTIFIVPVFANIFQDLGVELPALTQFMLLFSEVIRSWRIFILIGIIIAVIYAVGQYYKTPIGRLQIDRFFLKMPLFGGLNQKSVVARFCRVFGTLTRSGVPILYSLEIVRNTTGNQVIANAIDAAKIEIQKGGMISLALQKEKVFPMMVLQMISIGEETGELDAMMMKIADFYEDEVEQAVKALTSIIEPVMIVIVAGMVGVILLSMYLPMFKVFNEMG